MTTPITEGKLYKLTQDLSRKEIVKLIRNDLKSFKRCKFSVTCSDFQSIHINILKAPEVLETKEYLKAIKKGLPINPRIRLTPYGKLLMKAVKNIWNLYNCDNSDSMTDYFSVNYYGNIEVGKDNKPFQLA